MTAKTNKYSVTSLLLLMFVLSSSPVHSDLDPSTILGLGIDLDSSENEGYEIDDGNQTGLEWNGYIESNLFLSEELGITLIPYAEVKKANNTILDRQDNLFASVTGFYSFEGLRFRTAPPDIPKGLSIGAGIWEDQRELSSTDRDSSGANVIASFTFSSIDNEGQELELDSKININKAGSEEESPAFPPKPLDVKSWFNTFRYIYSDINPDFSPGRKDGSLLQYEGRFVKEYGERKRGFDGREIIPRITLASYDLDDNSSSSEDLFSAQLKFRWFRTHSTNLTNSIHLTIGHDRINGFRATNDLESNYIRIGVNFEYNTNPVDGGGFGGSAGGRYRRP